MPKQFTILVKQGQVQWTSKALESMKKFEGNTWNCSSNYEDQCSPANPRLPMVADMERGMADAIFMVYGERPGRHAKII